MVERAANKVVSIVLIPVFVAIGILGILLPILPGIPFLLIAAIMASRHIPALENYLHQNHYTAKSMRMSHRFSRLTVWGKVRFCCWAVLKVTIEGIEWVVSAIAKVFRR